MLSLASLWPTLNEPVLSLSCIIMNIHLCLWEPLCVCDALAGMKEAISIYSITIRHFVWIISQADNNSTDGWNPNRTGFVLEAKEAPSLFPVLQLFTSKGNVAGQGYLSESRTIVCLHTYTHTSCSCFHLFLMKAQNWRKEKKTGKAWIPFVPPGQKIHNTSDTHSEIISIHKQRAIFNAK